MPLMPADVQSQTFREKYKGYDVDEVDNFLDEVTERLTELLAERDDLLAQLEQRGNGPQPAAARPTPTAMPAGPSETVGGDADLLQRTLLVAQRAADQTVADAKAEADELLSRAHAESERLVGDAERESAAHNARIREEADRVARAVEDLRRFRSEYRERVQGVIAEHLALLDRAGELPEVPPELTAAAAAVQSHAEASDLAGTDLAAVSPDEEASADDDESPWAGPVA